jgi:hypothetical protein
MKAHATIAGRGVRTERVEDGYAERQRRPLTHRISRVLFVVVGMGVTAALVCMVIYRTGSGNEVPWKYLAIAFGNTTAVVGFFACFVRAVDEVR